MWSDYCASCGLSFDICTCEADPPERCHTCLERIPEGAGGYIEGEGRQCQDCYVEWVEEARESVTQVERRAL